jgi:hypothetical protein
VAASSGTVRGFSGPVEIPLKGGEPEPIHFLRVRDNLEK